jgi:hypothetical protein
MAEPKAEYKRLKIWLAVGQFRAKIRWSLKKSGAGWNSTIVTI